MNTGAAGQPARALAVTVGVYALAWTIAQTLAQHG